MKMSKTIFAGMFLATIFVTVLYTPVFFQDNFAVNDSDGRYLAMTRTTAFASALRGGSMSAWNPNVNLGQSSFDGAGYPYSPLAGLFLFFSPQLAHTLFILLGLWALFFFSWLYFSKIFSSDTAAMAGTLIYVLSGPVFFHHSYYADTLLLSGLPAVLWLLRLYDAGPKKRFLFIAAAIASAAMLASNPDMSGQFLIMILIERLASVYLRRGRGVDYFFWILFIFSIALASLAAVLPLIEWIGLSTRNQMNYGDIFFPNIRNLAMAVTTGSFKTEHAYPPYYFYIGFSQVILCAVGMWRVQDRYIKVFGILSLLLPLRYFCFYILRLFGYAPLANVDHWRSMVPFMIIVGIFGATGIEKILARTQNLKSRIPVRLVFSGILMAVFFQPVMLAKMHIQATCLTSARDFRFHESFWRPIKEISSHRAGEGRITGIDSRLCRALGYHLRVLPAYTNAYNRAFEEVLKNDGPLQTLRTIGLAPLWWALEVPDARELAYYGVRFFVLWPKESGLGVYESMWRYRPELSQAEGPRVYENTYYQGRGYVVNRNGKMKKTPLTLEDISEQEIRCTVRGAVDGDRLILADLAYPGWNVTRNNREVPPETFRNCLRAVPLLPGTNEVVWVYSSRLIGLGRLCLLTAVFLLISLITVYTRRFGKIT